MSQFWATKPFFKSTNKLVQKRKNGFTKNCSFFQNGGRFGALQVVLKKFKLKQFRFKQFKFAQSELEHFKFEL